MIAAIEAGGTKFVLAVAEANGRELDRARLDTRSPTDTFSQVAEWFAGAERRFERIEAFGIASFGPIEINPLSPEYGTFSTTPKPGWSGASYLEALADFDARIVVDTDVNGAALGEWLSGAGVGVSSLAYTTVGTGIGTGILRDGKPLMGFSHYEAGHYRPARSAGDSWEGACPFHGDCLEGLASGPAILRRWGCDLSAATAGQVDQIGAYLAEYAATLTLLHMPEKLVFGGGVMKTPGLIEVVREETRRRLAGYVPAFDRPLDDRIVLPGLGDAAGITGAFELAKRAQASG